mmetsp:Transcript_16262/g.54830  ORF Transcript_16262/g.54830 Transcript_16262/m.54830 type:complete len:224 (-) Transcript_16262:9-680(-)
MTESRPPRTSVTYGVTAGCSTMRPPAHFISAAPSDSMRRSTNASGIWEKWTSAVCVATSRAPVAKSCTQMAPTVVHGAVPYERTNSRHSAASRGFSRITPRQVTTWSPVTTMRPSPETPRRETRASALAFATSRTSASASPARSPMARSSMSGATTSNAAPAASRSSRRGELDEPSTSRLDVCSLVTPASAAASETSRAATGMAQTMRYATAAEARRMDDREL